ncbi:hypothetical protein HanPSC8_Chr07g0301301 [Helianthus annuus]|nr:hypothetical protein HanPSC8_Chr07g0301301 [Helianthus annuus]
MDMRSMTGMKVAVNIPNVGYRVVGANRQAWAWQPLVHHPLLEAEEVQIPQMAEQEGGHDDVEVPPRHEQGGHQHPHRAYRAVRLPRSTNRFLDRILRNQDEQMRLLTSHGRQMDQLHDDMGWMMTGMGEMYKHMGMSVPPRPSPRVYQGQGPFYTQQPDPSMSSFTQPIPSMQASGPSYSQPDL